MYVREAHPTDGRAIARNRFSIADPRSLQERQKAARDFAAQLKITLPILIDNIDDKVSKDYSAMPDRIYVVDAQGKIAYKGKPGPAGFKVGEIPPVLDTLLGVSRANTFQAPAGSARPIERPGGTGSSSQYKFSLTARNANPIRGRSP
jgi:hypothetical protein